MANNRLWIIDDETGERILLAKGFSQGWQLKPGVKELESWLQDHDFRSSCELTTPTQLRIESENDAGNEKLG